MSSTADSLAAPPASRPILDRKSSLSTRMVFLVLLVVGIGYTGYSLVNDISGVNARATTILPYFLLGVALLIALGFEFVNGFHDTANAVATVIYTHSLPPHVAVLYSGMLNFTGVLFSSGAVAFGIISLLPVELILQVGSGAGFSMVFALLIAAILWNLGTWWLGLPASSSHTMIGSIIGVGVANALMHGRDGTSGVDWAQATKIGYSLLLSPLVGFVCAALLLLLLLKVLVKNRDLYQEPRANASPPWWIRGVLILTCGGVSFAHGSNDGQKGMGLIMLILIGTVPIAYALNHAMPAQQMAPFIQIASDTQQALQQAAPGPAPGDPRQVLSTYVRTHAWNEEVLPALGSIAGSIGEQVNASGSFAKIPDERVTNVRNDMYLTSEAIRFYAKDPHAKATHVLSSGVAGTMAANRSGLQLTTLRNLLMAWVLTLPAAILLSGTLYWLFRQIF
jgi:PiT family inorganic phosphate transporter